MHQVLFKFALALLPRLVFATHANDNLCGNALRLVGFTMEDATTLTQSTKRGPLEHAFLKVKAREANSSREFAKLYNEPPFAVMAGPRLVQIERDPATHEVTLRTDSGQAHKFPRLSSHFPLTGSPNGRYILTANPNETVLDLVNLDLGRTMLQFISNADAGDGDYRAAIFKTHARFSGDGHYLTVAHPDSIDVVDVSGLRPRLIHSIDLGWPVMDEDPKVDLFGPGGVAGYFPRGLSGIVEYLPQTVELLAFYHGRSPRIFAAKNPAVSRVVNLPERGVRDAIGLVDHAHQFGFSVRDYKVIDMFSLPQGEYLRTFYAHGPINEMAISPSGRYLAYAVGRDGGVGVLDLANKSDVARFEIEVPTGQGSLLSFDGDHRLFCGVRELGEVFMFNLP